MSLQEIKEELARFVDWYAEDKKTNTDLQSKINKVFDYIATKEIETAELKADKEWLDNINNEQTEVILRLQAEKKQIIERERVVPEHSLSKMIDKNKELKKQLEDLQLTHTISVAKSVIREQELEAQIKELKSII